jgi:hypothetical protein
MSTPHTSDLAAAVAARDAARHALAACRARIADDAANLAAATAAHRERAADAIGAGTKPPSAPVLSVDARAHIDAESVLVARLADAEHAAKVAATALRDHRIEDANAHRLASLAAAVARARRDLATIAEAAGPGAVRRLVEQVGSGDPARGWPATYAAACSCPEAAAAGIELWPAIPSADVAVGEIEHLLAGTV